MNLSFLLLLLERVHLSHERLVVLLEALLLVLLLAPFLPFALLGLLLAIFLQEALRDMLV